MALQHFYARVPARMSLFNKMDGYDTFAHSAGVTADRIAGDLNAVCQNPVTKNDLDAARKGILPPAYCQFSATDGTLIQSAVSFLNSDYTGERSAYMVHSLLLSDEERAARLDDPDAATLDSTAFVTELGGFSLTADTTRPDTDYPELALSTRPASPAATLVDTYDVGMLKRLIYAMIGIPCGKAKALFLSIPSPIETFSQDCLEFLNTVLQIFPYHLRGALSFVTYTGDYSKYPTCRIKCMLPSTPAIPTVKGITIKMGAKDFNGISDANIAANAALVDFFFSLLTDDETRRAFLDFCAYVVERNPALQKITLKNLTDLVFLFRSLSGRFPENAVLPDDNAVHELIAVYEKNREFLPADFRARSADCLRRYPAAHTPIPKNVFSKLTSLYPDEPEESRRTAREVVLKLIHTDVMREKLFAFLRQNYESESPAARAEIMENLCRVYYGGFLQESILEFMTEHFPTEPAEIRTVMLERLLLTIRTPKVQQAVLAFVGQFYDSFSDSEKELFYATFEEMLPEGDALTRAMADTVDDHIEDERREAVAAKILKAVEADEKHSEPKVCRALVTAYGFTERVIIRKALTDWSKRRIVEDVIAGVCARPLLLRIQAVRECWEEVPTMPDAIAERLLTAVQESITGSRNTVFDLIAATDVADTLTSVCPAAAAFSARLREESLYPATVAVLPTVFDFKRYTDGPARIADLAADRPYLTAAEEYGAVTSYRKLIDAVQTQNYAEMILHADGIPEGPMRGGAVELLLRELKKMPEISDTLSLYADVTAEYLKTGEIVWCAPADALRQRISRQVSAAATGKVNPEDLVRQTDEQVLTAVLNAASAVYATPLRYSLKGSIAAYDGDLAKHIGIFLQKQDKKGRRFLEQALAQIDPAPAPELLAVMKKPLGDKSSGGVFKKLFGK